MTVDQMLWHVNQFLAASVGEPHALKVTKPNIGTPIMRFLLLNVPWPKSAPTNKGAIAGEKYDFEAERARCKQLIAKFVSKPVDGPEFELFVRLMREHPNVWSKVTCPERLSVSGPPALNGERDAYRDVAPFARRIVETFPDRVLWGTDWPHPNLKDHMPDDGLLVDFIPHVAVTAELQQKLLVDNPLRLYWPENEW